MAHCAAREKEFIESVGATPGPKADWTRRSISFRRLTCLAFGETFTFSHNGNESFFSFCKILHALQAFIGGKLNSVRFFTPNHFLLFSHFPTVFLFASIVSFEARPLASHWQGKAR
jgi:hypothetical protein